MSKHNRSPLEPGEDARLETLNEKILATLVLGPKTNADLSGIALDYGRRIRDLRSTGHRIDRKRIDGGLNLYTLRSENEPIWSVNVQVTLSDGAVSIQKIFVSGTSEGQVRNRAQHMATRVKVLESECVMHA